MIEIDGQPISAVGRARLIQEVERLRTQFEFTEAGIRDHHKLMERADAALRHAASFIEALQQTNAKLVDELMVRDVALVGAGETIAGLESEIEALKPLAKRGHEAMIAGPR